ncbi:MAG TPA: helix-turn-helix transcriptional regulator [Streptosporangiaceae bacterium]|jgi:AraC-like DNA-binding protein/quercetin dioxygenase-like cupin family protein
MSQNGQPADPWQHVTGSVIAATFPMPPGVVFNWHVHDDHQLAWAASGVLTVRTEAADWVLPPTRALWIPAGLRHETLTAGTATMRSLYIRPDRSPASWADPVPVAVTPMLAELIGYLDSDTLDAGQRARAEALLADLLRPVPMTTIEVRMPDDERAAQVAARLLADPADSRTLAEWGAQVSTSERTLARAFRTGTGMTFGPWRRLVRLQAALPRLASGQAVGTVARHVGYQTASAFVAAFRKETGLTPAAYFQTKRQVDPAAVAPGSGVSKEVRQQW